jgi:hypothetical protein
MHNLLLGNEIEAVARPRSLTEARCMFMKGGKMQNYRSKLKMVMIT